MTRRNPRTGTPLRRDALKERQTESTSNMAALSTESIVPRIRHPHIITNVDVLIAQIAVNVVTVAVTTAVMIAVDITVTNVNTAVLIWSLFEGLGTRSF